MPKFLACTDSAWPTRPAAVLYQERLHPSMEMNRGGGRVRDDADVHTWSFRPEKVNSGEWRLLTTDGEDDHNDEGTDSCVADG